MWKSNDYATACLFFFFSSHSKIPPFINQLSDHLQGDHNIATVSNWLGSRWNVAGLPRFDDDQAGSDVVSFPNVTLIYATLPKYKRKQWIKGHTQLQLNVLKTKPPAVFFYDLLLS